MIYVVAAQTFRSSSSLRAPVFMALFKVGPQFHIYCVTREVCCGVLFIACAGFGNFCLCTKCAYALVVHTRTFSLQKNT